MLEYIEKNTVANKTPEYFVIWLHGLGADCYDFVPVVSELKLNYAVKFIFPNAPMLPITLNNGYVMRAWYDLHNLGRENHFVDSLGIEKSVQEINQIIEMIIKSGVDSTKIFLAGFSQGGVISYNTLIKSPHKLGGLLALSCYFPHVETLAVTSTLNKSTPILAIHGLQDHVVPHDAHLSAYNVLKDNGFNIKWRDYMMEHNVCPEEINDIKEWLEECFASSNSKQS